MEEKDYNYSSSQDDELNDEPQQDVRKSIRGYRVVIVLLAVILVAMSLLYFNLNRQQHHDFQLLQIDRDSIQNNLSELITEYDSLKYSNDTIASNLEKANEMMAQLKKERSWNYAKIKQYEREVGTLRTVLKSYIRQIDSLNTINRHLSNENVTIKKEIATERLRADVAEERADELNNKVQIGAVLRARGISVASLNGKGKPVSRVKNAAQLRVDFTVAANELSAAGDKMLYLRIISPDGYLLSQESLPTFDAQGEHLGYSDKRGIDYQNEDVDVSIYYKGSGFTAGAYKVEIYADGVMIGSASVAMR